MGDYRATTGEPVLASAQEGRRRRFRRLVFSLGFLAAVAIAGGVIQVERRFLATGYVTTEVYAEARPATVGTVASFLSYSQQLRRPLPHGCQPPRAEPFIIPMKLRERARRLIQHETKRPQFGNGESLGRPLQG